MAPVTTLVTVLASVAVVTGLLVGIPARARRDALGAAIALGTLLTGAWVLVALLVA